MEECATPASPCDGGGASEGCRQLVLTSTVVKTYDTWHRSAESATTLAKRVSGALGLDNPAQCRDLVAKVVYIAEQQRDIVDMVERGGSCKGEHRQSHRVYSVKNAIEVMLARVLSDGKGDLLHLTKLQEHRTMASKCIWDLLNMRCMSWVRGAANNCFEKGIYTNGFDEAAWLLATRVTSTPNSDELDPIALHLKTQASAIHKVLGLHKAVKAETDFDATAFVTYMEEEADDLLIRNVQQMTAKLFHLGLSGKVESVTEALYAWEGVLATVHTCSTRNTFPSSSPRRALERCMGRLSELALHQLQVVHDYLEDVMRSHVEMQRCHLNGIHHGDIMDAFMVTLPQVDFLRDAKRTHMLLSRQVVAVCSPESLMKMAAHVASTGIHLVDRAEFTDRAWEAFRNTLQDCAEGLCYDDQDAAAEEENKRQARVRATMLIQELRATPGMTNLVADRNICNQQFRKYFDDEMSTLTTEYVESQKTRREDDRVPYGWYHPTNHPGLAQDTARALIRVADAVDGRVDIMEARGDSARLTEATAGEATGPVRCAPKSQPKLEVAFRFDVAQMRDAVHQLLNKLPETTLVDKDKKKKKVVVHTTTPKLQKPTTRPVDKKRTTAWVAASHNYEAMESIDARNMAVIKNILRCLHQCFGKALETPVFEQGLHGHPVAARNEFASRTLRLENMTMDFDWPERPQGTVVLAESPRKGALFLPALWIMDPRRAFSMQQHIYSMPEVPDNQKMQVQEVSSVLNTLVTHVKLNRKDMPIRCGKEGATNGLFMGAEAVVPFYKELERATTMILESKKAAKEWRSVDKPPGPKEKPKKRDAAAAVGLPVREHAGTSSEGVDDGHDNDRELQESAKKQKTAPEAEPAAVGSAGAHVVDA